MTIKMKVCSFFSKTIDYLCHIIASGKLHVSTEKTEASRPLQQPSSAPEPWPFYGLCNFYPRFVPNFAKLASPSDKRLKKGEPLQIERGKQIRKAADDVKHKLTTPLVLALPRSDGNYTMDTDACDTQMRCALLERQQARFRSQLATSQDHQVTQNGAMTRHTKNT